MPAITDELVNLPSGFTGHVLTDSLNQQQLLDFRHCSGLRLTVLPRPGFSRKFTAIGVPFGSVHADIRQNGKKHTFPAGTAHFLEHCIFSRDEQGGLMGRLAELGAAANAYTSYSHTMYYFTAVDGFDAALDLYLGSILDPYLEADRIEAERPIIISEIDQYLDDPDMRGMVNLLQNMYSGHPVRDDIGGTAATVSKINSGHLRLAREMFYHPGRLRLTAAGDIDPGKLLETISRKLENRADPPVLPVSVRVQEPDRPCRREDQLRMDISAPSFIIGIKDPRADTAPGGLEQVTRQRSAQLLLASLLSPATKLHESLYNQGLINESFNYGYIGDMSFGFAICGGESMQPEAAARAVMEGIISQMRRGIDPELFAVQKRSTAGSFVQALDSIEHSGMVQAQCSFLDINLFDYPKIYDNINCASAMELMSFFQDAEQYSLTVLKPEEVKQ